MLNRYLFFEFSNKKLQNYFHIIKSKFLSSRLRPHFVRFDRAIFFCKTFAASHVETPAVQVAFDDVAVKS